MQLYPKTSKTAIRGKVLEMYQPDTDARYKQLLKNSALMKQEKKVLQEAFDEIEDIYNNAPCGYHSLDETGLIIRINNTELRMLGYTRKEILNKVKFSELLTPDSLKIFKKEFPLFKARGSIHELEMELVRKDGTRFPILLSATAIYDEKGKYKMSRTIIYDISERKLMEQKLREQNEKLYWLNYEKDRFIGIASHDLQHPITAISILTEHLVKDESSNISAHGLEICKMLHESAIEMRTLIKNYLDIQRFENGRSIAHPVPTDVSQLVADIVARYREIAFKKEVLLFYNVDKHYTLNTDPAYLQQVIENLVSNAVKFTHRGKKVFVTILQNKGHLTVEIKDEGVGIPKKEIPLLFEKFSQISSRPTGGELSTGLGLSIVKYLADLLQATIQVSSKPGKGSVFSVNFEN